MTGAVEGAAEFADRVGVREVAAMIDALLYVAIGIPLIVNSVMFTSFARFVNTKLDGMRPEFNRGVDAIAARTAALEKRIGSTS